MHEKNKFTLLSDKFFFLSTFLFSTYLFNLPPYPFSTFLFDLFSFFFFFPPLLSFFPFPISKVDSRGPFLWQTFSFFFFLFFPLTIFVQAIFTWELGIGGFFISLIAKSFQKTHDDKQFKSQKSQTLS